MNYEYCLLTTGLLMRGKPGTFLDGRYGTKVTDPNAVMYFGASNKAREHFKGREVSATEYMAYIKNII